MGTAVNRNGHYFETVLLVGGMQVLQLGKRSDARTAP